MNILNFRKFLNFVTCYGVDPFTASIASTIAGTLLQGAMKPDSPKAAEAPTPTPAPQAATAPDATVVRQSNTQGSGGGGSSPASTLLTGSQGIDPNKLKLASTLLTGATGMMGS